MANTPEVGDADSATITIKKDETICAAPITHRERVIEVQVILRAQLVIWRVK